MDPFTEDLPFLVVHGEHVWKVLLIASIAAVCGLGWLLRWRSARAQRRAAVAQLGRGEVVLRGTLGGRLADGSTGVTTLRAEDMAGVRTTASRRAGELWIDTGDRRVLLEGELCVIAGSFAVASRNGVPAVVRDAHLEAAREGAPWLHRVGPYPLAETRTAVADVVFLGDRVVARGRLERAPGPEPAGYRDADVRWALRPHGLDPAIELAACQPATAWPRMHRGVLAMALACTALLSWSTLKGLGQSWVSRCTASEGRPSADGPIELTNTQACVLAAAMPRSRDQALFWIHRALEEDLHRDERSVRRLAGAARLATDCATATATLLEHARLEDAARSARACGDTRDEYVALMAQGRFEDAAGLEVPSEHGLDALPHVPTLIAAGQWTRAADRVREHAEAARGVQGEGASRVRHLRCLEALLRGTAGDRDAARRIRELDAEEPGRCTPMLAELASPDERRRLLQDAADTSRVTGLLRWAAGLGGSGPDLDDAVELLAEPDDYGASLSAQLAWLVASERGASSTLAPHHTAALLAWRAVAQVLDGQPEAAVASAREAVAMVPADPEAPRFLRFLPAAAALYTPATELAPGLDLDLEHQRDATVMHLYFSRLMLRGARSSYERPLHERAYQGALAAARQGDGEALARYMAGRYAHWKTGDVMAVLPRIRTGREPVVRQLVWPTRYRDELFAYDPVPLWRLAVGAAIRREAMKLAGVADEAARWTAIYRRFDAVLDDRRRLIALMLWEG